MKKLLRKLVIHDDFLVQLGELLGVFFSLVQRPLSSFHSAEKTGLKFTSSNANSLSAFMGYAPFH